MLKIVACSDTHGLHDEIQIPDGDIFIHGGDLTRHGTLEEIEAFNIFLSKLPHRHKLIVAGNHDWAFERTPQKARALLTAGTYLEDQSVEVEGLRIYGSPWQPEFFSWAFNLRRGSEIRAKWDLIPKDTDVLITHGPPHGFCDRTPYARVGCQDLLETVRRVRPKVHVFGHIHEGYGMVECDGTIFMNASNCNEHYDPINPAMCFQV